ncbi:MAG: replicative DNA helicase [Clostridiales bacterium]|nr:replicative DNA helicase [Clostridiales bacterium]MCF8023483.1 replicative DNA helicase [Clostridiales bacterium]
MNGMLNDLTSGYRERVNRLAIFDPLYELERKVSKDKEGNPIDWFSLGLLALLFFFESMLTRRKKTSVQDLAEYIHQLNMDGPVKTNQEGFYKIAREIVDTFRDASGKKKARSFYNWETRQYEHIYYSLLEVRDSDLWQNIQYYRLTERGLELVFATKEYFSEFHISINQLLLRKQLEKGELNGAMREIDEMRVAVEELHRKMEQLNHEVQRNIISHETQDRYLKMLDDTHSRLVREHEEFKELRSFVVETKTRYEYENGSEKEHRAYSQLVRISRNLEEVHNLHHTLLDKTITLKRAAMQAARESLYHAGLTAFNFNQDVTSRVVTSPLPPEALTGILRPFLGPRLAKTWSPLEIFAPQQTGPGGETENQEVKNFLNPEETGEDTGFLYRQQNNFRALTGLLREAVGSKETLTLAEIIEILGQRKDGADMLSRRSFYDFWLLMHQRSPVTRVNNTEEDRAGHLLEAILSAWPEAEELSVSEKSGILRPHPRYEIQNMTFTVRRKNNAI